MSQAGHGDTAGLEGMLNRLHLRELLAEVRDRVAEIVQIRDRLDRLIEAMLVVASGLDIDETLRRIVHASIELTGAKYGALGVRGAGNELADLVFEGIDEATRAMIGDLPHGAGCWGRCSATPIRFDWRTYPPIRRLQGFHHTIHRCARFSGFRLCSRMVRCSG